MKKRKYYKKLFAVYAVIIFFLGFIAAILFSMKNSEIVELDIDNTHRSILTQFKDKSDTTVRVAFNLIKQIKMNEYVIQHALNRTDRDYYIITKICGMLGNYVVFSDMGFTINITVPQDKLIITPLNTIDADRFYEENLIDKGNLETIYAFLEDEKKRILYLEEDRQYKTMYGASKEQPMVIVKKESVRNVNDIIAYMFFNKEQLVSSDNLVGNEAYAIIKDGRIIFVRSRLEIAAVSDLIREALTVPGDGYAGETDGITRRKLGRFYLYITKPSTGTGLQYMYITPANINKGPMGEMIANLCKLILLLLVISVLTAFFITNRMYEPIKRIILKTRHYGVTEAQDEFSYVEQTVSKINETNKRLRDIIDSNRYSAKARGLQDLLFGLISAETFEKQLKAMELEDLCGQMFVAVSELSNFRELDRKLTRDAVIKIKNQMALMVEECLKKDFQCEFVDVDYKSFAFIVKGHQFNNVKNLLNMLCNKHSNSGDYSVDLITALGSPAEGAYELSKSFNDARELLQYRYTIGKRKVILPDDLKTLKNERYFYPVDMESQLINSVAEGKREDMNVLLNRIWRMNFEERNMSSASVSQFMYALIGTVNRILQLLDKNAENIFDERSIRFITLRTCESNQDLREMVFCLFDTLTSIVCSENENLDNSYAGAMLSYIHENYVRNISLVDVADQLNLSPGYVSMLFKDKTGENFKYYLNVYRIKKAKEIIETKNVKVNELGKMVGCYNVNTFIRMFKKYENISPGEYAKKIWGQDWIERA